MDNSEYQSWQLVCSCHSYEHQLNFDWDGSEKELIVSVHLCHFPFWKRLINGFRYIFGHKSKFGDFEEVILSQSTISANAFKEMGKFLEP